MVLIESCHAGDHVSALVLLVSASPIFDSVGVHELLWTLRYAYVQETSTTTLEWVADSRRRLEMDPLRRSHGARDRSRRWWRALLGQSVREETTQEMGKSEDFARMTGMAAAKAAGFVEESKAFCTDGYWKLESATESYNLVVRILVWSSSLRRLMGSCTKWPVASLTQH